jgi:hypothetical protein
VVSLAYGPIGAVERQGYCPRHRRQPPARSEQLRRLVAPGCNIAFDVIASIGLARYLQCRQSQEIQLELSQHGVEISARTIRALSRRFVALVEIVHRESIPLLRRDMRDRGGYILHIDGTCEEGSRVLLVCLDSLSGQVLESRKISSENRKELSTVLQRVRRDWGLPLALVHDLRKSLIQAAAEVFPGVPQFVCHFHFAADVGKDLLSSHHDRLRNLFRRTRVRPQLGALCRKFKVPAAEEKAEPLVRALLEAKPPQDLGELATPAAIEETVRTLSAWILAFSHSGDGYGFPFDIPYLTLYERIVEVHGLLHKVLGGESATKRGPLGPLVRLREILEVVVAGDDAAEFRTLIAELKRDQRLFQRLRQVLRICPPGGGDGRNDTGDRRALSPTRHQAILREFRDSLSRRRGGGRKACQIIVSHLDKYSSYLFGHVLKPGASGPIVPRTNNPEESLFRTIKRQCRRLHGRGHLGRDLDEQYEGTPLVLNLSHSDYCETVYGGTKVDDLATRFSLVDPQKLAQVLTTWRKEQSSLRLPRTIERLKELPQRFTRFINIAVDRLRKKQK